MIRMTEVRDAMLDGIEAAALRGNEGDKAHVAAAAYAQKRSDGVPQAARKKYATDDIWLAHYEGFRAGLVYNAAREEERLARIAKGRESTKRSLAPHTLDPMTSNCTLCGATYEAMLDNLFPVCTPKA